MKEKSGDVYCIQEELDLFSLLSSFGRDPHLRQKQQRDSNVVESSTVSKSDAGSDGT